MRQQLIVYFRVANAKKTKCVPRKATKTKLAKDESIYYIPLSVVKGFTFAVVWERLSIVYGEAVLGRMQARTNNQTTGIELDTDFGGTKYAIEILR